MTKPLRGGYSLQICCQLGKMCFLNRLCLLLVGACIFILLIDVAGNAQTPLRIFEPIGMTDKGRQLYPSASTHVIEDRLGRIWYSTLGTGIIRYDGYNFKQYSFDPIDSTSLISNRALRLLEDAMGNIWVSTLEGLCCLDVRTGKFRRFRLPVGRERTSVMHQCQANMILVGENKGLWDIDPATGQFHRWRQAGQQEDLQNGPLINDFLQDKTGAIWACSEFGLLRLHPDSRTYEIIQVFIPGKASPQSCISMIEDRDGWLWLYCRDGLVQFNTVFLKVELPNLPDVLKDFLVADMLKAPDGALWLAGRDGIVRWLPATGEVEKFSGGGRRADIYPGSVTGLCSDRLGNLWLTVSVGLRRTTMTNPDFQLYQVEHGRDLDNNRLTWTAYDADGGILMNTTNGLFYSPRLGQKAVSVAPPKGKTPLYLSNHVTRMADGSICVAWREGGASIWMPKQRQFVQFWPDTAFSGRIIEGQCFDTEDPQILWVGTSAGLWKIDQRSRERQLFAPAALVANNKTAGKIIDNGHGGLWFDMVGGMAFFDKKSHQFSYFRYNNAQPQAGIASNEVLDIACTPEGDAWVATFGGVTRIKYLDNQQFSFFTLNTSNGLRNNSVIAVHFGADQRIWILFNGPHIAGIDPNTLRISHFDLMSPIQARPVLRKSIASDQNGQLFIGTTEGLVVFKPAQLDRNPIPPNVVLTAIAVNNQLLNVEPEFLEKLSLSSNQNAITFEFAGIHTLSPYSNLYAYQLIGYDTAWVNSPADLRRASYTNLPPGRYLFKVKAANNDEVWGPETVLLSFIIEPHYWQSNWFRFLVLTLIAAVIYAVLYNRLQQRRLSQEKELAEQNARYKSQFLANMSHEIRTPMNAILGLSRLLDEDSLTPKQKEYIEAIRHSSEDLLRIINDILDYSKIESGQFSFYNQTFNLHQLFHRLEQTFLYQAQEKSLYLRFDGLPEMPPMVIGDPVRITQILTNLISNAIKFTEKGGIKVQISHQLSSADTLQFYGKVIDTGVGIPPEKVGLVFESFSQVHAEEMAGNKGTGLGLTIAKQLVEQQGGKIELNSKMGEGTTVVFELPLKIPSDVAETPMPVSAKQTVQRSNLRILLVEDTPFNQLLAVELLRANMENVFIDIAENGQVALDKITTMPYDLVLMDVKMPVMDGLEATRRIRAMEDEKLKNIPIIGLTANAVPAELEKCKAAGMNKWVTKPIQPDELLQTISDFS